MNTPTARILHEDGEKYYCATCGALYLEEKTVCDNCGHLVTILPEEAYLTSYGLDIIKVGLWPVLKINFKQSIKVLFPIVVVIVIVRFILSLLLRIKWEIPAMQGLIPLWVPETLDEALLKTPALSKSVMMLVDAGFKLEKAQRRVATYPEHLCYVFRHKSGQVHATIMVNAHNPVASYTRLIAFTQTNLCVMVDNAVGTVATESVVKEYHFPNVSVEKLLTKFRETVEEIGEVKTVPSIVDFDIHMQLFTHRHNAIEVDQGALSIMSMQDIAEQQAQMLVMCTKHPASIAVRRCETCSTALCEECVEKLHGKAYCSSCIEALPTEPEPIVTDDDEIGTKHPAGRSTRFMAFVTDILLVSLLFIGFKFAVNPLDLTYDRSLTVGVLGLVVIVIGYLLLALKLRRSLGKVIWRLTIEDEGGGTVEYSSLFVRFAYKLASLLFIFPLITYITMLFNKNGVAVHDRLSSTRVYTASKLGRWVARIGSVVVICGVIIGGYALYTQVYKTFGGVEPVDTSMSLSPIWSTPATEQGHSPSAYIRELDVVLYQTNDSLFGYKATTGEILWKHSQVGGAFLYTDTTSANQNTVYMVGSELQAIDILTGEQEWSYTIGSDNKFDMKQLRFYHEKLFLYTQGKGLLFNRSGKLLWEKTLPKEMQMSMAQCRLNEGVLFIAREHNPRVRNIEDMKSTMFFFSLETGELLWQKTVPLLSPMLSLDDGVELFWSGNKTVALNLQAKQSLWQIELADDEGILNSIGEGGEQLFVTTKSLREGATGNIIRNFSDGYYCAAVQDSTLILRSDKGALLFEDLAGNPLMDKVSFDVKDYLQYLGNHKGEYLFMCRKIALAEASVKLLRINPSENSHDVIELGEGYFSVVGVSDSIAIVSDMKSVGAYSLQK